MDPVRTLGHMDPVRNLSHMDSVRTLSHMDPVRTLSLMDPVRILSPCAMRYLKTLYAPIHAYFQQRYRPTNIIMSDYLP